VLVCFAMETEVARVKRACVLSQNQIREIEMDSESVSRTIIKMELTEQMTDCGNYETYWKLYGQTFQNFTTLPNIWQ